MPLLRKPQGFLTVTRDDYLEPGARKAQLNEREDVLVVVRHEQHGHATGESVGEQQGIEHAFTIGASRRGNGWWFVPRRRDTRCLEAVHRARRRQGQRVSLDVVV